MKKLVILAVVLVAMLASVPVFAITAENPTFLPVIANWAMNEGTAGTTVAAGQILDSAAPNSNNLAQVYVDPAVNPTWVSTGAVGDGVGVNFDGNADHLNFGFGANDEINLSNTHFQYYMRFNGSLTAPSNIDMALFGRAQYFNQPSDIMRLGAFQADWYGVKNYGLYVTVKDINGNYAEINAVDAGLRLNSGVWFEILFEYEAGGLMKLYVNEAGGGWYLWKTSAAAGPVAIGDNYHAGLALGGANPGGAYDKRNFYGVIESAAIYGIPEPSMLLIGAAALLAWRKK